MMRRIGVLLAVGWAMIGAASARGGKPAPPQDPMLVEVLAHIDAGDLKAFRATLDAKVIEMLDRQVRPVDMKALQAKSGVTKRNEMKPDATKAGVNKHVPTPPDANTPDANRSDGNKPNANKPGGDASPPEAVDAKFAPAPGALNGKPPAADLDALVRLSVCREFVGYFGRIDGLADDEKSTLKWLVARPEFFPTLMMSLSDADPPDGLLRILAKMKAAGDTAIDAYPDLATAVCVVYDKAPISAADDATDSDRPIRLFRYFVNANARRLLRYDLRVLPWQLAVYVVDLKISEPEILWAVDRYRQSMTLGSSYFDVPYDTGAYYTGSKKLIDGRPYVLPNLMEFGGVCVDQAYYASSVCKSLGVPACTVSGQGGDGGVAHAWIGYLHAGPRAEWNFDEGRYRQHLYWTGETTDPQTGEALSEADVALLGELQDSNPAHRLASIALTRLASPAGELDAVALRGDADTYPATLSPDRQLDVYAAAIALSPGNRRAWTAVAELGAAGKLSDDQMQAVATVIARFALDRYPEFAFRLYMKMASARGQVEQLAIMEKCGRLFSARPDLLAEIRIAQGDVLRKQGKTAAALAAYGDVLEHGLNAGPGVLKAMDHADQLLRDTKDFRRLALIYKHVWENLAIPEPSAFASTTPYYVVGNKLADLLDEGGDSAGAAAVRSTLQGLLAAVTGK